MLIPPISLDVAKGLDRGSMNISYVAVSSLLQWDDTDGKLTGEIAESWQQVSATEYVFKLRPQARFTDGKPVTAEDVVFSIERHLGPGSNVSGFLQPMIESVRATRALEVTVKLKRPDAVLPFLTYPMIIQKEHALKHKGDLGTTGGIISAAPYRVESFTPNVGAVLTRVENHWGEKPPVKRIVFRTISDVNALQLALQSGQIDGVFDIPLTEAHLFDRQKAFRTSYAPAPIIDFLSFDLKSKPLDDIHVRRAIAHAVNREELAKAIFHGHAHVTRSIVMPPLLASMLDAKGIAEFEASLPDYPFDLEKAKKELARSAYPNGFTLDAPFSSARPEQSMIFQTLAKNLQPLGITLKPRALPHSQYVGEAYAHKNLGLRIFNLWMLPNAPSSSTDTLLNPENARENGLNMANMTDPEVNELRLKFNATMDEAQKLAILKEMLVRTGEILPYFPLFYQDGGVALSTKYKWTKPFNHYIRREQFPMYVTKAE